MMESHKGAFWLKKVIKMKPTIDVESEDMGYEYSLKQSNWTKL